MGRKACTEPQCLYRGCTLPLHEDKCTFLVISRSVLNRMRKYQNKIVEKIRTHILYSVTFFINRTFCEIMWENIVEQCRQRVTLWRMRIACWITKATDTHSEYVILTAFPQQQWLRESPLTPRRLMSYIYIYIWSTHS